MLSGLACWMAAPSPKLETVLKKAGFNLKEHPEKPHAQSERAKHRNYVARLRSSFLSSRDYKSGSWTTAKRFRDRFTSVGSGVSRFFFERRLIAAL
jgi:hypothetical protein